jgi:hypothetical protein
MLGVLWPKKTNNYIDKGHPCLVPLDNLNDSEICPFVCIDALADLYNCSIEEIKIGPKPNFFITATKYAHPTLSNAYFASIHNATFVAFKFL